MDNEQELEVKESVVDYNKLYIAPVHILEGCEIDLADVFE